MLVDGVNIESRNRRRGIQRVMLVIATLFVATANAEPFLGSPNAPVTIIQYGSLTCSCCVRFHTEVLPLIQSRYIESGHVRFIFRDFPTGDAAARGAIAARCAGDDYYSMLDALYADVANWSRASNVDAALIKQADLLGLDSPDFRACLTELGQRRELTDQQRAAAEEYAVSGTPTFIVNGNVVRGFRDIEQMKVLINAASPDP